MALITNFYNGDMARPIRETILQNFANVAKYIPNEFLSLSSIERENLTEDYKTYFKLVFDTQTEYVYRWSDIENNWEAYLIRAKDEFARQEAADNREASFADAVLGININGDATPYAITFYNRDGVAKDDIFLTAENILYDSNNSVKRIIDTIRADILSINEFIGNRDALINNAQLSSTTLVGAINEVCSQAVQNKNKINEIIAGTQKVGNAAHADLADNATVATTALDSNKLGGELPSYYATAAGLAATNANVLSLTNRMSTAESDIRLNQTNITNLQASVASLTNTTAQHTEQIEGLVSTVGTLESSVESLQAAIERLGWNILPAPEPEEEEEEEEEPQGE